MHLVQGVFVIAVIPKKGFELWLREAINFLEESVEEFSLEDLADEALLYVIPTPIDLEECSKFVKDHYLELFQFSLNFWCADKRLWPKKLSYQFFNDFFSIEFHSRLYSLLENTKASS